MSARSSGAALVISGLLIGCGSAGPSASPPTPAPPTAIPATPVPATAAPPPAAPPTAVPPTQAPPQPAAAVVEVRMMGNKFQPPALEVRPGTTVRWINADSEEHDVIAKDGSFEALPFGTGGTYERAFATAGAFPYYCDLHDNMEGTVTVR